MIQSGHLQLARLSRHRRRNEPGRAERTGNVSAVRGSLRRAIRREPAAEGGAEERSLLDHAGGDCKEKGGGGREGECKWMNAGDNIKCA